MLLEAAFVRAPDSTHVAVHTPTLLRGDVLHQLAPAACRRAQPQFEDLSLVLLAFKVHLQAILIRARDPADMAPLALPFRRRLLQLGPGLVTPQVLLQVEAARALDIA